MVSKMKSFAVVTMAVLLTACTAVLAYFAVLKADTAAPPEETDAVTTVPEKTTEAAGTEKVPEEVKTILEEKDRQAAGPTAPACGLTLVKYEFL